MANEYFSAIGSAISGAVTGIIDDPQYTLYVETQSNGGDDISGLGTKEKPYRTPQRALFELRDKFITQNGFATIKMGPGRFVLTDSIEIRHPQGDRIGLKGEDIVTYNMVDCHGYTASHSADRGDNVVGETRGSNRPRYYRSTIKLAAATQNDGDTLVGSISGVSGEYLLVQDWSMTQKDNYDHIAWDYNLEGKTAKRSSLMGCNILDGDNTDLETMLAVMACLDEYIGVSNTNMHLRAAVGKSGRVLVPHPADYKWMAAGQSPWFPTFQVYRQSVDGGWGTAFASLLSDLIKTNG